MATVIDLSILNAVSLIIVFMLVFVGSWGVLRVVNPFKEEGSRLYGLIAFFVAVLVVLSRKTVNVLLFATPWLILLAMVAFFLIFFSKMFGVSDAGLTSAFGEGKGYGWMIFFVGIILVFAIGNSFGQDLLSAQAPGEVQTTTVLENGTVVTGPDPLGGVGTASSDFGRNLTLTLFHPKILGVLFLFLLGTLTILLLNKAA